MKKWFYNKSVLLKEGIYQSNKLKAYKVSIMLILNRFNFVD
jgi:hypothetical protein